MGNKRPETPLVSVDIIIRLLDEPGHTIVLIERRNPPPGYAIPGGFVDIGESCEAAAIREAREETGLDITLQDLLGVYSDPRRDPRGATVSAVYTATAHGKPIAGDDAANCMRWELNENYPRLAFDHEAILGDYQRFTESGIRGLPGMLVRQST